MIELGRIADSVRRGMTPAYVYNDAEVFAAERELVFGKNWFFLAHESEVPDNGDYLVRQCLDDSFIVVRGEDGVVRVLFNMCLHRGMQVCRTEIGNASHFRCPYHGWTYKNDGRLTGMPFFTEAYGGPDAFQREGKGLVRPPATDTINGLIFVNMDRQAKPLRDSLGEFATYLDFFTMPGGQGVELRGPQRWRMQANWKLGAENFCGDNYHVPYSHQSVGEIGLMHDPKPKRQPGGEWFAGGGGGGLFRLAEGDFHQRLRSIGYPDELIESRRRHWPDKIVSMVARDGYIPSAATAFPNLSFLHFWARLDGEDVVPYTVVRLWQPVSEHETEVFSWCAVDKAAPPEFNEASYRSYLRSFGTGGMLEQDDIEHWVSITRVARGLMARSLDLNYRMGLLSNGEVFKSPLRDLSAPGVAFDGYGEYSQRRWFDLWCDCLTGTPRPDPQRELSLVEGAS